MNSILDAVRRLTHPLSVRISNTVARAIIRVVDDGGTLQTLQLTALRGETLENVERFQEFGFMSVPPADGKAEAVIVCVGGDRGHPLAVATAHRPTKPPEQPEGTVMLYNDHAGTRVTLDSDGTLYVASPSEVVIDAPLATVTGDLEISGDATIGGISFADFVTKYNAHTHTDPQGGSTGPPLPQVS